MSWTFAPTLATPRDRVRVNIGDTNADDPQLADETLDALLTLTPDERRASAQACRLLAAKFAREVDRDIRDSTIREGDRSAHYLKLAAQFDRSAMATPQLRPAWPAESGYP
jgi:hypothetical protein